MLFGYLKAAPTTYVLHYQRSRLRREGPGLTFLYFRPEVGARAVTKQSATSSASPGSTVDPTVHKERLSGNESGGE